MSHGRVVAMVETSVLPRAVRCVMTSYDDRPNNDPWAPPAWAPRPGPPVWASTRTPGLETRQVLLVLGAACLVAALAAGTAVVWHALGPTGQAGVMVAVTATV